MTIKIQLPVSSDASGYQSIKADLKQLELAIHHAQKAVESAERDGILVGDSSFICFRHPALDETRQDQMYDELQNVELEITLQ